MLIQHSLDSPYSLKNFTGNVTLTDNFLENFPKILLIKK